MTKLPCGCDGATCCPEEQRLHNDIRRVWAQTDAATATWKEANPGVPIGIWYATDEYRKLQQLDIDCHARYYMHYPESTWTDFDRERIDTYLLREGEDA